MSHHRTFDVVVTRRCRRCLASTTLLTSLVVSVLTLPTTTVAFAVKKEQHHPPPFDDRHPHSGNDTFPDFENSSDLKHDSKSGGAVVTLGELIGLFCLICGILYCIGIGWKIFKVWKGTYVPQEPVFLKYK